MVRLAEEGGVGDRGREVWGEGVFKPEKKEGEERVLNHLCLFLPRQRRPLVGEEEQTNVYYPKTVRKSPMSEPLDLDREINKRMGGQEN